jgi:cysteine synthase
MTNDPRLESRPDLRRYRNIRELIATPENSTPLLGINRAHQSGPFGLYLKLEWFNPFGSIKDRAGQPS